MVIYLFIATPYMNKQFYLDFDHIRPYHPYSLKMVFQDKKQIQFYANSHLELSDIKYVRIPHSHRTISYYTQDCHFILKGVIDLMGIILYYLSFRLIGVTTIG